MNSKYDPREHISVVEGSGPADLLADQREITIQSFETTVPFDFDVLKPLLDKAWLSPAIPFGVMQEAVAPSQAEVFAVLGLQGNLAVRAYDHDERRPLFFSWKDAVVETMAIRLARAPTGMVSLTTFGGGPRITEQTIRDFCDAFLRIRGHQIVKLQFDVGRLRALCFERFMSRLYMVRFTNLAAQEYRSIDLGLFKSRKFIDPNVPRMLELRDDPSAVIESFDSKIEIASSELSKPADVRFKLRGASGDLRLYLPRLSYAVKHSTFERHALAFYRVVSHVGRCILDADYYAHRRLTLAQLETLDTFPEFADPAPYREMLVRPDVRQEFLASLDVSTAKRKWLPHLRALNELIAEGRIERGGMPEFEAYVEQNPSGAKQLVDACSGDPALRRVGSMTTALLRRRVQELPADVRGPAEDALLRWALRHDDAEWDVDVARGAVRIGPLRRTLADVEFTVVPEILAKLMRELHNRLLSCSGNIAADLEKMSWCTCTASEISPNNWKSAAAIRLISAKRVPRTVREGDGILKEPVEDLAALDDAVLSQFGLPLWPHFRCTSTPQGWVLENAGLGAAMDVAVAGASVGNLLSGEQRLLGSAFPGNIDFLKYGVRRSISLTATEISQRSIAAAGSGIRRGRFAAQLDLRRKLDPDQRIVGLSPILLSIFEEIEHANKMDPLATVLLSGEPGVGKTHIAELIHKTSRRARQPFRVVNAANSGGDPTIQRGEWVGYGKGHGIVGIPPQGQNGHLASTQEGTIFIDEFAELSKEMQATFLSVLDRRSVQKVGGQPFTPDVRCIFATNADLDDGRIRRDLLDRIQIKVRIPSLRDRLGDVLALAMRFAGHIDIDSRLRLAFLRHAWPGNVRELGNTVALGIVKIQSGRKSLRLEDVDLPDTVVASVHEMDPQAVQTALWITADRLARNEGFEPGTGLQRRAGEILGFGEAQASRMYSSLPELQIA